MGRVDLVIIVPPAGVSNTVYPPYGAMYIAAAAGKAGLEARIINVDTDRISNEEVIGRLKALEPGYIGISGIVAPSYKYIKGLSSDIRSAMPESVQILGGGLSSAAETVLRNMPVDYVVAGEGDTAITELIGRLREGKTPSDVTGIYCREGERCVFTGTRKLIADIDTLPYPAFDLVDMSRYMPDGKEFIRYFIQDIRDARITDPKRKGGMVTIPTGRGCFGKCSFCFRAYPGLRTHSMKYVFDLIEHCMEKFGTSYFSFGDECFAPNKEHNRRFIEEYKRRKLDLVFRILGMRVDTVDRDILRDYKDIGCWMIEYGFEAGNQRMLNIIDKRVTVEQNRQVALWTKEAGIYTSPTLVLAMPGETDRTVNESIGFLKSLGLGYKQYQWSYALPIPGSPLYDFAKLSGAINNEDEYLTSLDGKVSGAGVFHVNLTDELDETVSGWAEKVSSAVDDDWYIKNYKVRLLAECAKLAKKAEYHLRNKDILKTVWNKLRCRVKVSDRIGAASDTKTTVKFRKRGDIVFEDLIKGMDDTAINREMALKNINTRLAS
ncbi:MAG TPA: radical SAM protein [Candidatus Omnitrophota bacterium]|nr:radical SAM protein [Candidatus Omnitrophota bacterium]